MATSGPAHRVQSAVEVYGYPQGHLGHLSADEEAALTNFKVVCTENGLYSPGTETDPGTHDDATLLRFLRARRFVVLDAITQFSDTEAWRKANQLDVLYETIDIEQYDATRRLYPQWTGRRDKRGIPVYAYDVKNLNSKTMAAYEKSAGSTHHKATTDGKTAPKLLRLFALYENLTRFVMPLSTIMTDRDYPKTPITQSNNIVDISGVGLKQFWNLRTHMQDASTLATAHYPETLDRIFIIGAPAFFPTVWGWIKRWFDPITTSKIFILGPHEVKSTLESFIDPANIPKKYGGQLDFNFGDTPRLDPLLTDLVTWENGHTEFPLGPLFWIDRGDYLELKAVGSVDKQDRAEMICKIKKPVFDVTTDDKTNGVPVIPDVKPDVVAAPVVATETKEEPKKETPLTASAAKPDSETKPEPVPASNEPKVVVQAGEIIPASRPEPETFHSATEDLTTLTISEKMNEIPNGTAVKEVDIVDPALSHTGMKPVVPP